MKKGIKLLICALCLVFCLGMLAGCGEGGDADSTATPAPTGAAGTGGATATGDAQNPYLRPRDESLQNAIKEGETYRYFIYTTTDSNNPFESMDDESREYNLNRKNAYEEHYGITIEYVTAGGADWYVAFAAAAASGTPTTDIYHAGGPFTMYTNYNYNGNPGSVLEPLSQYSQYADFTDEEYFDQTSQAVTTYSGELYFAVPNGVGIDSVSSNLVVMFNKEILATAGYEDTEIYDMWRNKEWNWDIFRQIARDTTDLDNEIYGITTGQNNSLMWGLMPSNNSAILSLTEDAESGQSYWAFSGNTDNALAAWNFFIQMGNDNSVLLSNEAEVGPFRAGNIAMMVTYVNRADTLTNFRQYPQFGIVPVPMGPQADDYVSTNNWFTPLCVFKGTANPAGSVQLLSEYLAPRYAKSSEDAQAAFEASAVSMVCDTESVEVLRSIPDISITEPYIIYWSTPSFNMGETTSALCNLYTDHNTNFISGAETPSVLFESIESALNNALMDAQIVFDDAT